MESGFTELRASRGPLPGPPRGEPAEQDSLSGHLGPRGDFYWGDTAP
jgi:hypothetical protein